MEQSIQPLNVAAGTLLFQLLFVAIIAIASSLHSPDRKSNPLKAKSLPKSPILFVAIVSFAVLLISDEFYSIWSPLFQGVGMNTVSAGKAISFAFLLDIALVTYLIFKTGGSNNSPFTSALFTLPSIAIFLRLPPSQFLLFSVLAALTYFLLLGMPSESSYINALGQQKPSLSAAAFINIACLFLSIFTGYITKPVPINELQNTKQISTDQNSP